MSKYDPYALNCPRERFFSFLFDLVGISPQRFGADGADIHLCAKSSVERLNRASPNIVQYFKKKNPSGFHHDLAAQDVFFDNFGILSLGQFSTPKEWERYMFAAKQCLDYLSLVRFRVVQRMPYWGSYFNSRSGKANAGDPRSLLRFQDWFWSHKYFFAAMSNYEVGKPVAGLFHDWDWKFLFSEEWSWDVEPFTDNARGERENPTGANLPEGWPTRVDRLCVLHPDQATPDLPVRVGHTDKDFRFYREVLRNQGSHPTCVAHAFCVGMDLMLLRQGRTRANRDPFSTAWLHCDSARQGWSWNKGRNLDWAANSLQKRLPCSEKEFPYNLAPVDPASPWQTPSRIAQSEQLTRKYGLPIIQKIDPKEIAQIKTLLAAGWVVVLGTSLPASFFGKGLEMFGLPLTPLIGQQRLSHGHAWLLVGYDHVDTHEPWRYQGRFIVLNSWGGNWPELPLIAPGICSMPFAMLLTEGFDAYAMRFGSPQPIPFSHSDDLKAVT